MGGERPEHEQEWHEGDLGRGGSERDGGGGESSAPRAARLSSAAFCAAASASAAAAASAGASASAQRAAACRKMSSEDAAFRRRSRRPAASVVATGLGGRAAVPLETKGGRFRSTSSSSSSSSSCCCIYIRAQLALSVVVTVAGESPSPTWPRSNACSERPAKQGVRRSSRRRQIFGSQMRTNIGGVGQPVRRSRPRPGHPWASGRQGGGARCLGGGFSSFK